MTLAFVGRLSPEDEKKLEQSAAILADEILPVLFILQNTEMFGLNKDKPVRRAFVVDETKKKKIIKFYGEHADRADEFFNEKRGPNFHVTLKGCEDELPFGKEITSKQLFIKQLGKHDPIWYRI